MLTLDCRHPDIVEFIQSKGDTTSITGANISVKWTDEFFDCLKNGDEFPLRYPVDSDDPDNIVEWVDPKVLLEQSAMYAHGYDQEVGENSSDFGGDPGCMFIDRMKQYATDYGYPMVTVLSTNPCGEIGMDNDSCRLFALNYFSAVKHPFTDNAHVDLALVEKIAYEQQILLDLLVDLEIEKIDAILEKIDNDPEDEKFKRIERETWEDLRESAIKFRRTGNGFTALGDTLAACGLEYGTEEANEMVDALSRAKFKGEWNASIDMAIQKAPFLEWHQDFDTGPFFDMMKEEFPDIYKRNMKYGRRNISLSTVAPTGSVSMLANINGHYGTTSGIEPVFSTEKNVLWHTRRKKAQEGDEVVETDENGIEWTSYKVFHEGFKQWLEVNKGSKDWKNESTDILMDYAKESPYVTSAGLDYKDRIDAQAIVQKYTTHSISSTLNLPENAHWSTTYDIYKYAQEAGLKGVTIFRNGSKRGVLEGDKKQVTSINYDDAPKRPDILNADVHIVRDQWMIIVGMLDDKPYELFVLDNPDYQRNEFPIGSTLKESSKLDYHIEKTGSKQYHLKYSDGVVVSNLLSYSPSSDADVLTRFVSMLMRHGVKMEFIVEQVEKADISVSDFSAVVNSVLKQYVNTTEGLTCDNCGSENVAYVEGCATCLECGASKCS